MMNSRLLTLFTALVASAPAVCYGFLTENMCTNVSDACANVPEMLPNLALRPNLACAHVPVSQTLLGSRVTHTHLQCQTPACAIPP